MERGGRVFGGGARLGGLGETFLVNAEGFRFDLSPELSPELSPGLSPGLGLRGLDLWTS